MPMLIDAGARCAPVWPSDAVTRDDDSHNAIVRVTFGMDGETRPRKHGARAPRNAEILRLRDPGLLLQWLPGIHQPGCRHHARKAAHHVSRFTLATLQRQHADRGEGRHGNALQFRLLGCPSRACIVVQKLLRRTAYPFLNSIASSSSALRCVIRKRRAARAGSTGRKTL